MRSPTPFHVVINAGSGRQDAAEALDTLTKVFAAAGQVIRVHRVDRAGRLPAVAREAVTQARADAGTVVAAGGDGTINAVAQAALGSGRPFGVIPLGTFNYFARHHGIPTDTAEAARVLLEAQARPVQVGWVNDRVFLVNASLGLYPQLLEDREAYKRQFGRSRWVARWAGLLALLREHRQLHIWLEHGGHTQRVRTPTLFVGNNPLQLQELGLPQARAVETQGMLAGLMLKPVGTLQMLWLALKGAFGQLGDADQVRAFEFRQITVRPALPYGRRSIKVATDGEVGRLRPPLTFRVSDTPLMLIRPDRASGTLAGQEA